MGIVEGEGEYENKNQKVIAKEEEEKWLKHYASFHEILLVGEGDFSFSLCLAKSFGSASNIVATSLDTYDMVIRKYKNAKSNIEMLKELGAYVCHGVDATKIKLHTDFQMRKFDRIIFNFPHAGFHGKEADPRLIAKHRHLLSEFFRNASSMLRANGEVHVSHKTTPPFCYWNLSELAEKNYLLLTECVDFNIEDYPGYNNKRGASLKCDEPFPLGKSSTFKFRFNKAGRRMDGRDSNIPLHEGSHKSLQIFADGQWQPTLLNRQHALSSVTFQNVTSGNHGLTMQTNTRGECFRIGLKSVATDSQRQPMLLSRQPLSDITFHNVAPENHALSVPVNLRDECFRIFGGHLDYVVKTFGRTDSDVSHRVREALRLGFERFTAEGRHGRPSHDYLNILEELHHISTLRSAWLRDLLRQSDEAFLSRQEGRAPYPFLNQS